MGTRTVPILMLFTMLFAFIPMSPLVGPAEAQITCCDSLEVSYFLLGEGDESDKGQLSPFSADLGTEAEAWVTNSVTQLTEVARWRLPSVSTGDFPDAIWQLTIPYEVVNAVGMQANASAEVKIGGKSWYGSATVPPQYIPGEATIDISIEIEAGSIHSSGELVVVVLSVQTLVFASPGDDAGVRFFWGTEENRGWLDANLPLLDMDWQPAQVNGRMVSIPVVLRSGHGSAIWEKSISEFKVDGIVVDSYIATVHPLGAQVYLQWEAPSSAEDGVYEVNLSLRVDPDQVGAFTGGFSYALVFGLGGGTGMGIFPADEPLRGGGSELSVNIQADIEQGDRLRRTTKMEFNGPMAAWLRWGLDNIGNSSLNSLSQWRAVDGNSATEASRNNHQVDEAEILALENHLSGRASSLKRFLFDGLMLEPERLLGVEPIEAAAAPTVNIDMQGEYGFSSSPVTLTIESLENVKIGERRVLFDNFVRPQPSATPIWAKLTLEAHMTTSMMLGTAGVEGSGIDYSHKRLVLAEIITVPQQTLSTEDELADFSVVYAFGDITNAPLTALFESLAVLALLGFIALSLTKNKPRTGVWMTALLLAVVWGYSYFFALPLMFMLGAVSAVGLLMVAVAIVTPRPSAEDTAADEAAFITIMPAKGLRKAKRIPKVNCPACGESNLIHSKQRPVRIPCCGCGARLRVG